MNEFCVYDLMDECLNLIAMIATAQGIKLDSNIENCQTTFINADRKRLKQVVLNLLTNAIKYNIEGGTVGLQCMKHDDSRIMIEISDTGIGMSQGEIEKIFQPFVRVGESQEKVRGTGIGLALSRNIMLEMGGDIVVDSTQGQGSKFTIMLNTENPRQVAAV